MKYFSFAFIFLLLATLVQAQTFTPVQRKKIFTRIEEFESYITKYSGNKSKENISALREKLFNVFTPSSTHAIDFGEQYSGGVRDESIDSYLQQIADEYDYDIAVRFTEGELIDCINTFEGKSAVYVTEKFIGRKGKVSVYSEVIQITLPGNENNYDGYKIKDVAFAADFKYSPNIHYECANLITVRTEDTERVKTQDTCDQLFYSNKYTDAIEGFLYMADRYPKDDYPKLMLLKCKDNLANDSIFLQQGKRYLFEKQYSRAISWYTGHMISFPADTNNLWIADTIRHIRIVSADENYNVNMRKALEDFKAQNFDNACYYYTNALKFKPGDRVALDSLTHARVKDIDYANNKIDSAIRVYGENEAENAGVFVKILNEYGRYGNHVGTEQYLRVAYLIYHRNALVLQIMNLGNSKDFNAYKKKCYDNLITAYNHEKNRTIRRRVKYFIEEIVN